MDHPTLSERDRSSSPLSTPPSSPVIDLEMTYLPSPDTPATTQETFVKETTPTPVTVPDDALPIRARARATKSNKATEPIETAQPIRTSKRAAAIRANANLKALIIDRALRVPETPTQFSVTVNNYKQTFDDGDASDSEVDKPPKRVRLNKKANSEQNKAVSDTTATEKTNKDDVAATGASSPVSSQADLDFPQENSETPAESIVVATTSNAAETNSLKRKRVAKKPQETTTPNVPDLRPEPSARPIVWSNQRGGLCESLPYYRAYKGSLHTSKKVAKGFLIDVETDHADYFGAQVVISSVGGGRTRDAQSKSMVRTVDAPDTAVNVESLKNAYKDKSLVAIVAGEKHPLYPCKPPHPYAVLAYFHITDMWKEKQIPKGGGKEVLIWRVRFEKADLSESSWWMPAHTVTPVSVKAEIYTCNICNTPSKRIFTAGWFCLNHSCSAYYSFPGGEKVDVRALEYTPDFLNERSPYTKEVPSVIPDMPNGKALHGTELALRRGFVCPECGCCNRRIFWNTWACENKDCGFRVPAPMNPYPLDVLHTENQKFKQLTDARRERYGVNNNFGQNPMFIMDESATIFQRGYIRKSQTLNSGGHLVRQYFLPDAEGKIIGSFSIISSTPEINAQPGGPDEIFRALEVEEIGLRRNPAAIAGHKLEGLTRHFQQNFGARYKFGVSVQSKGFNEAPDCILRALQRLIWVKRIAVAASNQFINGLDQEAHVGKHTHVTESQDFNELLALGYMENDCINYHDDGESELGPVVAALALGSPCTMRFRPKSKTGFQMPIQKDRGKVVYKEVLEVCMKHGDMMVMCGTEIQRIYEHAVQPMGNRRFALTARYIDPQKMISQSDKDDAAVKGAIPKHAENFVYNGF